MNHGSQNELGNPLFEHISGRYYLRVTAVEELKNGYSYTVEDAQGCLYRTKKSNIVYTVGQVVLCNVRVVIADRRVQVTEVSIGKQYTTIKEDHFTSQAHDIIRSVVASGKKIKHKPGSVVSGSVKGKGEKPSQHGKEEHFRLIYTPMGNKR